MPTALLVFLALTTAPQPSWEVAVEVAPVAPLAPCHGSPLLAEDEADGACDAVRLDVLTDAGALAASFRIAPIEGRPDWRADFDPGPEPDSGSGGPGADWAVDWAALGTAYLTFAFVREGTEGEVLARYAYAPTALAYAPGQTGFFRPVAGEAGAAAVRFEVAADGTVRAGEGAGGPRFEDVFAGRYVIPYDYVAVCAPRCGAAVPGYFLAPLDEVRYGLPTRPRIALAGGGDLVIPPAWGVDGVLSWEVPGLVLGFAEGQRLVVEGALHVTGMLFSAAEAGRGWGGVVFQGADEPPSVLRSVVVEDVRRTAPEGDEGPRGAVEVHAGALVLEGECQVRDGEGVVGLLASGGAEVDVGGHGVLYGNRAGGVHATGGARIRLDATGVGNNQGPAVEAVGEGTRVEIHGAIIENNAGVGVRARAGAAVHVASGAGSRPTSIEHNMGGLHAEGGSRIEAGRCGPGETVPCLGRATHDFMHNADGGHADVRSVGGSVVHVEGNRWHTPVLEHLVLEVDETSVLTVCPVYAGGPCEGGTGPSGGVPPSEGLDRQAPNPERGRTSVRLTLVQPSDVEAALYDAPGSYAAGTHALAVEASSLPAGVYVVRVAAGDAVETQPVTLLR